jgi:hypothetical protein
MSEGPGKSVQKNGLTGDKGSEKGSRKPPFQLKTILNIMSTDLTLI